MPNVLLITSDQHNPFVTGYAGDPLARTPNLDALAEAGITFSAAYTNSPICMPARASLATGRYSSAIGAYDNGAPYQREQAESLGHRLRANARPAVTFGKLHFDDETDSGFDAYLPLQAKRGYLGARVGWARGNAPPSSNMADHVRDAGVGVSEYELYDRHTTQAACRWLTTDAPSDTPWFAHVSFAYPHYPFRAPADSLPADDVDVPLPPAWRPEDWPHNRELDEHRRMMGIDAEPFTEDELRQVRWVYTAMVQFVDHQVGEVLAALDGSGAADDTVVIYTSDHGDMLGGHGFAMKSLMYDASARVPMLIIGPGVGRDVVEGAAVSLVDVYPTAVDVMGLPAIDTDAELPGASLRDVAPDRIAFSEYHGPSSTAASYLVRRDRWKYVAHMAADTRPQLFDLVADPHELDDRVDAEPDIAADLDAELHSILDPEATDLRIRAGQAEQLAAAEPPPAGRAPKRTAYGTLAKGWSVPSPAIMAIVDPDGP